MKRIKQSVLPGIIILAIISLISTQLNRLIPLAGVAIIAMFIGMLVKKLFIIPKSWQSGITFTSKKMLKFSIILMGANLSLNQLLKAGKSSFILMTFTLLAAFLTAWLVGKYVFTISFAQRNLIAIGTGICGGSAIMALSPVLEAKDSDIAFAISATFIFDIFAIILFPIIGIKLGLSSEGYGLWAGTAVNDTSSVIATGYAFSEEAGQIALIVKMARTTMLLPIGIILNTVMIIRNKKLIVRQKQNLNLLSLIPWFVILFIAVVIVNTITPIPQSVAGLLKKTSSFIISMALAAVGLNTDLRKLLKTGRQILTLGAIVSLVVVIISLIIQYKMNTV